MTIICKKCGQYLELYYSQVAQVTVKDKTYFSWIHSVCGQEYRQDIGPAIILDKAALIEIEVKNGQVSVIKDTKPFDPPIPVPIIPDPVEDEPNV